MICVSVTIKNETKKTKQKGGCLGMLLDILGASLLGNLLTEKGVKLSKTPGPEVIRPGEGTIRAGQNF